MKLIDANIIIRFLLKDHPIQSSFSKKLLSNYQEDLLLTDVVVAEIVWVLTSYYKLSKKETIEKIYPILNLPNINCNKSVLIKALYFYKSLNIDYIDAYLAAYAEQNKQEGIYSFDKDLDKIKSVKRIKL